MIRHILIVGHQKCGTTTVYNSLKNTGFFATAKKKELNYFFKEKANLHGYCKEFKSQRDSQFISIDASPMYIFDTKVLNKIYKILGDNVLIVILRRDPIKRAISHYYHSTVRGHEVRQLLPAMMDDCQQDYKSNYHRIHHSYIQRSKFDELENIAHDIFCPTNIVTLNFDENIKQNIENYILRRLDIDTEVHIEKKNQSYIISNTTTFALLRGFGLKGKLLLRIAIILKAAKKDRKASDPLVEEKIGGLIDS